MKKTILIPTDFTIQSLNTLKVFLGSADKRFIYDVILLHGIHTGDSITDLLHFSKKKVLKQVSGIPFDEALLIIKNKHESLLNSIRKDIFTGWSMNAFENYLEGNKVDEILIPSHRKMYLENKNSFDIIPFILKSNVKVVEIGSYSEESIPERGKLAEVFYNGVST